MSGEEKDICVNNLPRLTAERPEIERGDLSLVQQPAYCTNKPQKGSSRWNSLQPQVLHIGAVVVSEANLYRGIRCSPVVWSQMLTCSVVSAAHL